MEDQNLAPRPAAETSTASKYSSVIQRTREQKGHSLTIHLLISPVLLFINLIYISASPNHYWHA